MFGGQNDVKDVNGYLARLLRGFKETYQKVTLNLPIRKDLFDLDIDEDAFDRYFSENYQQDEKRIVNSIYQREFAINYYHREKKSSDSKPDFSFSLIHFKKVRFCHLTTILL